MKSLKTPKINKQTKILSFDLETNGLHGDAFAVGAVVMDGTGTVHDEFTARTDIVGGVDDWVAAKVVPVITDMEVTHPSYKQLRDDFWAWFVKAQAASDYVLVNNGYPVEYRFLIQCQDDDMVNREWQHPFPILELTSLLIASGNEVQGSKNRVMAKLEGSPHHPLFDAKTAALTAFGILVV